MLNKNIDKHTHTNLQKLKCTNEIGDALKSFVFTFQLKENKLATFNIYRIYSYICACLCVCVCVCIENGKLFSDSRILNRFIFFYGINQSTNTSTHNYKLQSFDAIKNEIHTHTHTNKYNKLT